MNEMKYQFNIGRLYFGITKENNITIYYLLKDGNRPIGFNYK